MILKEPSRRITTFDEMWAWIVHIITKSHDLKSTVHKGSFLEEVTQALFKEIYDTASSVRIVAASTNKTQGDDGRVAEKTEARGIANRVVSRGRARPRVRVGVRRDSQGPGPPCAGGIK